MKKLLLMLSCVVGYTIASAQSFSFSPTVGCPNLTHDLIVNVTNGNVAVSSPTGYTVTLNVVNASSTTLKTHTETFTGSFAANETKTITIEDVPFEGPMTCTVTGSVSWMMIISIPPNPPTGTSMNINIPQQNYTVAYPPTLTISETSGALSTTTTLNGYSVRYYLDADYNTSVDESTTGNYTPANDGSYTAKAYDPISTCVSENPSNAVVISTTSVKGSKQNMVGISVYPNPVTSVVTIESEISSPLTYVLSDLNGTVLRNASFAGTSQVNMEELRSGAYILTIKNEKENIASYKLTK